MPTRFTRPQASRISVLRQPLSPYSSQEAFRNAALNPAPSAVSIPAISAASNTAPTGKGQESCVVVGPGSATFRRHGFWSTSMRRNEMLKRETQREKQQRCLVGPGKMFRCFKVCDMLDFYTYYTIK